MVCTEDAQLIGRAQRGDTVALAQLLQTHYLSVKKYLITITLDRSMAEDLTQETMIRAMQRIGQYSGKAKFSTWLMAIATNLYTDALRHRKVEQRVQGEALQLELVRQVTGDLPPAWDDLVQRLGELPRDVLLPIILKHYHGYTYEEIAEWMGLPVGTVKSRIFNGLRTLRRGLSPDE
ncbi:MAG: RNA polymerase sigma factor SigY [Mycobacterium leprae]